MKTLLVTLAGGLLIGAFAASYAELPPATAQEKAAAAAKAEKDAATKAKAAKELSEAQDKAVANYRKNKGGSAGGSTAQPRPEQSEAQPSPAAGADPSAPTVPSGR